MCFHALSQKRLFWIVYILIGSYQQVNLIKHRHINIGKLIICLYLIHFAWAGEVYKKSIGLWYIMTTGAQWLGAELRYFGQRQDFECPMLGRGNEKGTKWLTVRQCLCILLFHRPCTACQKTEECETTCAVLVINAWFCFHLVFQDFVDSAAAGVFLVGF